MTLRHYHHHIFRPVARTYDSQGRAFGRPCKALASFYVFAPDSSALQAQQVEAINVAGPSPMGHPLADGAQFAGMPALHFNVISPSSRPAKSQVPTLFTHTLCPYAERAFLVLLEKGRPFNLVHIDLSCKPTWYRQVNPRGLVPAVEYKGAVHVESLDICRWADAELKGPSLVPSDVRLRQEVEQLLRGVDSCVSAGLDLLAGRTGRYWGIGSGQSASQHTAFEAQLSSLQAALQRHGGPFLAGPHLTLADIAYYPFVKRFDVGMQHFAGYDLTAALGGSVGRWLDAMGERASCRIASADDALLLQAYVRHRCLDFFDYDSYGVFDLHPQNREHLPVSS